jgi:hypothetical protein
LKKIIDVDKKRGITFINFDLQSEKEKLSIRAENYQKQMQQALITLHKVLESINEKSLLLEEDLNFSAIAPIVERAANQTIPSVSKGISDFN